jgi:spermidine synthase
VDIWKHLDSAQVPGTQSTMSLHRRGEGKEYSIWVDGRLLMDNQVYGSEVALADLVCDSMADCSAARILIGGLGMGFTLAAALGRVGPEAQVTVAELVPAIVGWNRGPAGEAAGHPLADSRARVFDGDVADAFRDRQESWDAILLDVDNGPTGLTRSTNNWLYSWEGLEAAYRALRPQGVLGVWSAADDSGFTRRITRAGFAAEKTTVRARGKKGGHRHTVWTATRAERPRWN